MPKRSSKSREDENQIAARIASTVPDPEPPKKNPHAVALGRKGGKIGGKARAAKLTERRRKQIARKAAKARWKKTPKKRVPTKKS